MDGDPISPATGGAETILVAEDEPAVRSVVVRILESAGYRVLEAENGATAIEQCAAHDDIDLVVLDVVLPDHSGPEVYERLLELRPGLPALFSSGYGDSPRGTKLPPGCASIAKPFRIDAMLSAVRRVLDRARA